MDTNMINCPVCGAQHEIGNFCPVCGFEPHLFSKVPSENILQQERGRLEISTRIWEELQELRGKKSSNNKPLGYLITDRLVVYCLYEGLNTFGTTQEIDVDKEEVFQSIHFAGVNISPRHFQIEAKPQEGRKVLFSVKALQNDKSAKVFLNTMTQMVDENFTELNSGDNILFSNDSENVNVELKFRKNINR